MRKIWMTFFLMSLVGTGCAASRNVGPPPARGEEKPPPDGPESAAQKSRQPAPDFSLETLQGQTVRLSSLKGKVVLLDFWATWCPPCVQEVPHFKELYGRYRESGFEILGISMDGGEEAQVRSFIRENDVRYPVAAGDARLAQAYGGIRGLPTSFLIDKRGRIAKKFIGYQDKQVFEKGIQALLAE